MAQDPSNNSSLEQLALKGLILLFTGCIRHVSMAGWQKTVGALHHVVGTLCDLGKPTFVSWSDYTYRRTVWCRRWRAKHSLLEKNSSRSLRSTNRWIIIIIIIIIIIHTGKYVHCVSKNDTDVARYNFDTDQPILIIFGKDVDERVCCQTMIVIPPLLTNVCALPGETWTPEIVSSYSCCIPCLGNEMGEEMANREIKFAHYTK